jgi:hypothetical protein
MRDFLCHFGLFADYQFHSSQPHLRCFALQNLITFACGFPYGVGMKGQLSAEMLVVLVLVLGLAVILASVMFKSADKAAGKIEDKTNSVLGASDKKALGEGCDYDSDCISGNCDFTEKKCA